MGTPDLPFLATMVDDAQSPPVLIQVGHERGPWLGVMWRGAGILATSYKRQVSHKRECV